MIRGLPLYRISRSDRKQNRSQHLTHRLERIDLQHVGYVRQRGVACGEGRHDFSCVRFEVCEAAQGRNRPWHLLFRKERHDAKLRQTAVVHLGQQALVELFARLLRVEFEWVVQVERHWVRELVEGWELARDATTHVMLEAVLLEDVSALAPEFEEANEKQDLKLRTCGQCVPLLWRGSRCCDVTECDRACQFPWENNAVGLQTIANESSHRDAAVLNLRVAQEADSCFITLLPKFR